MQIQRALGRFCRLPGIMLSQQLPGKAFESFSIVQAAELLHVITNGWVIVLLKETLGF